ncbi:hypothetical protein ACFPMF_15990 [Larkinella bovis]|uniref:Uncharacterized protein n=2 Tax=Larkinella bovis TaxID=683041 RepID=A0ABW0IE73_9BACT
MPYPVYRYLNDGSYTKLELSYQENLYIISDGRLFGENKEYYRGLIKNVEELMERIKQYSGNDRAKTEVGREIQDADFISIQAWEDNGEVFVADSTMRYYRVSKNGQSYRVEFDQNRGGFDQPTHTLGIFNSLTDAVAAIHGRK